MKVKVKLLGRVRLFVTPGTVAYQVPPSMGFSRQEYWSGLPFPSPGDLPDPGIEPRSPALLWMWDLDHEDWMLKNWCFPNVVLEKTLESSLDCKEIQPVSPTGNQSWMFIGRTDVEAETPILWLRDETNWLFGKDLDVGKDWRQEEKGMTEDEMVGWHHRLDGHKLEQSGSWWWTGKLGMLQSVGSQRVGHNWATELTDWLMWLLIFFITLKEQREIKLVWQVLLK